MSLFSVSVSPCLDLDISPPPPVLFPWSHSVCFYFYPRLFFSRLFTILFASIFCVHLCRSYKIAIKSGNIENSLYFYRLNPLVYFFWGMYVYTVKMKIKDKLYETRYHRLICKEWQKLCISTACAVGRWPIASNEASLVRNVLCNVTEHSMFRIVIFTNLLSIFTHVSRFMATCSSLVNFFPCLSFLCVIHISS